MRNIGRRLLGGLLISTPFLMGIVMGIGIVWHERGFDAAVKVTKFLVLLFGGGGICLAAILYGIYLLDNND